jgi:hypothetical protein
MDVEAMASTPTTATTINIGSQHNHGSGTFVGGNNYGDINTPATSES